jgi:hypothetical protein
MSNDYVLPRAITKERVKKRRKKPNQPPLILPWWANILWLVVFGTNYAIDIHRGSWFWIALNATFTLIYAWLSKTGVEWWLWERQEGIKTTWREKLREHRLFTLWPRFDTLMFLFGMTWPFYAIPLNVMKLMDIFHGKA